MTLGDTFRRLLEIVDVTRVSNHTILPSLYRGLIDFSIIITFLLLRIRLFRIKLSLYIYFRRLLIVR